MTKNPEKPWLEFYDDSVPASLDYPESTIPELFAQSAERFGDRAAVSFLGNELSYDYFESAANHLAAYLTEQGIKEGDRVLLLLPNMPQFIVSYYAILKLGAVCVPASPLDTAPELAYKVENSGARIVIFLDLLFETVTGLQGGKQIEKFIHVDVADYLSFPKKQLFGLKKKFLGRKLPKDAPDHRQVAWRTLINKKTVSSAKPVEVRAKVDELAVILYTGGTTGVSKGVMLSHRALVVNLIQARTWGNVQPDDVFLAVLPAFHGFGLSIGVNVSYTTGSKLVLMIRYDTKQLIQHLIKDKITLFAGVPTMYNAVIHHPLFAKLKNTSLRGCYVGAAPVPEEIKRQFEQVTNCPLVEGYGLTESVTAKSAIPLRGKSKPNSIGLPWPDVMFKVVDVDSGKPLDPGQEGELLLQTPDLMMGYWQNEEATNETIKDGWLYTGDIAKMDEEGYFYIVDRKKDLIISGGFNVYPAEIEEVLYQHDQIIEACVVGAPDAHKGEVPIAFVVLKAESTLPETDIMSYLGDKLIKYKIPARIEFRNELPKSPIGKVLRKELKKEIAASEVES